MRAANLKGEVIEVLNRYLALPLFLRSGFIPYVPEFDVGIDFILVREEESGDLMLKVQAKGRLAVNRKYLGRDIWMLFPDKPSQSSSDLTWYFCPHDILVREAKKTRAKSRSWKDGGISKRSFNVEKPSHEFLQDFEISNVIKTLSRQYIRNLRAGFAKDWH